MHTYIRIPMALLLFYIMILPGCFKAKKSAIGNDEFLVDSLMSIYQDSAYMKPYDVIKIFTEARKNISDSISSYDLLSFIAKCYHLAGNIDSSSMIYRQIIRYCEREKEPSTNLLSLQTDTYVKYGSNWDVTGIRDSAMVYYKKAYDLLLKSEDRLQLPNVCYALAGCYQQDGNYPQASYFYRKALYAADSLVLGNRYNFMIFFSMAKLYSEIENHELAEYYFQQAEQYDSIASPFARYIYTNYRGLHYSNIKDYPKALDWYRRCNHIIMTFFPQPTYRMVVETDLGDLFFQTGQLDSARYHLNRAKEFYEQSFEQPDAKFVIDGLYASLALRENRFHEAESLLLQPYKTALINPQYIYEHNLRLEDLYARKNDFRNAYSYRLKIDAYNDSVRSVKVRNNIAEIDMRYRQDTTLLRKDLRIATIEGQAAQWQNIALISLLAVILLLALSGVFVMYNRRKREREYRKQMATVTGLRMEIVRNRLSPHFMFNALHAMMPALEQHKELEQPFNLLIQMLRNNLHASEQVSVPLEEEIILVKNYLRLQTLGDPGRIQVEWLIADHVPHDAHIPSMSIQIPVENAVKYAFTPDQTDALLSIRITRQADTIHITVEDNGIGYSPGTGSFSERGTGNGLKMLYRTAELLNTRNRDKIIFSIENKNTAGGPTQGTCVSLIIPLNYHFEM